MCPTSKLQVFAPSNCVKGVRHWQQEHTAGFCESTWAAGGQPAGNPCAGGWGSATWCTDYTQCMCCTQQVQLSVFDWTSEHSQSQNALPEKQEQSLGASPQSTGGGRVLLVCMETPMKLLRLLSNGRCMQIAAALAGHPPPHPTT